MQLNNDSIKSGAAHQLATNQAPTPEQIARVLAVFEAVGETDRAGVSAYMRLLAHTKGYGTHATIEEVGDNLRTLLSWLESIGDVAREPLFASALEVAAETSVIFMEQGRPDQWSAGVSECEYSFLDWLQNGAAPVPVYSDPDFILYSLDPKSGGSTLEKVNHWNLIWWHCMKRLQARLLEFAALEIPEPKEITEADVEAMRRDVEGSDQPKKELMGEDELIESILAYEGGSPALIAASTAARIAQQEEKFTITPEEALALVRTEALPRFLAIREAAQGREWTPEEFAALCECLTPEGKAKIREAITRPNREPYDTEEHLAVV